MSAGKHKPSEIWHRATRKGTPVMMSPSGAVYYGTVREVRENALYPFRRESLASSIRLFHTVFLQGTIRREKLREIVADRRREAIMFSSIDRKGEAVNHIDADMHVRIGAAARVLGISPGEFVRRAIAESIAFARHDNGGTLPFTRHERKALERSGVLFDETGREIEA